MFWGLLGHSYVVAEVFWMFSRMLLCSMVWGFARSLLILNKCGDESYSNFGGGKFELSCSTNTISYRLSSSLGWLWFSRFFSIRSARSCLRTTVAYSIRPCSAAMRREATLPRSRMEKDLWASSVWMKVSRNILLFSSWLNKRRAFSTLAGDWEQRERLIKRKKKQNKNTNGKARQEGDERNMRNNNCCLNAYLEKKLCCGEI